MVPNKMMIYGMIALVVIVLALSFLGFLGTFTIVGVLMGFGPFMVEVGLVVIGIAVVIFLPFKPWNYVIGGGCIVIAVLMWQGVL